MKGDRGHVKNKKVERIEIKKGRSEENNREKRIEWGRGRDEQTKRGVERGNR
jgi:hypothetical protein